MLPLEKCSLALGINASDTLQELCFDIPAQGRSGLCVILLHPAYSPTHEKVLAKNDTDASARRHIIFDKFWRWEILGAMRPHLYRVLQNRTLETARMHH